MREGEGAQSNGAVSPSALAEWAVWVVQCPPVTHEPKLGRGPVWGTRYWALLRRPEWGEGGEPSYRAAPEAPAPTVGRALAALGRAALRRGEVLAPCPSCLVPGRSATGRLCEHAPSIPAYALLRRGWLWARGACCLLLARLVWPGGPWAPLREGEGPLLPLLWPAGLAQWRARWLAPATHKQAPVKEH